MALVNTAIKDILSIKIKQRHDGYTDQFSRILMVKILVVSALVTSVEFYNDKLSCIVIKEEVRINRDFVHSTCWIQGFYVYKEMVGHPEESGYYGMPRDVTINGKRSDGILCRTENDPKCQPLTKLYFTQYQYFPFYMGSLAVIYYMPYILFLMINEDIAGLRKSIELSKTLEDAKMITMTYFNHMHNGGLQILRLRVWANTAVKFLYLFVNFGSFLVTDLVMNDRYITFGFKWMKWSKLNNTIAYDYSRLRKFPKPGNYLLPSLGFCDVIEASKSLIELNKNKYTFMCEISAHIFYQYVLIVLWFCFIIGMMVSGSGLICNVISNLSIHFNVTRTNRKNKYRFDQYYKHLSIREIEYMDCIRNKNVVLYKEVVSQLQDYDYKISFMKKYRFSGNELL